MTRPEFTIATYNAGDKGTPPKADLVFIQERPSKRTIRRALPGYKIVYPLRSDLAYAYNPKVITDAHTRLTRIHRGRRKVTPARYVFEILCRAHGEKIAGEGTHLINNPFGNNIRGERPFRRAMWHLGWEMISDRSQELEARGIPTFRIGDFNRKDEHWPDAPPGAGDGYDREFYPPAVELVDARHGDRAGSDHKPLIGKFRFKKETP